MFVIWRWLERGQSGLFIQLQFAACVFFSLIIMIIHLIRQIYYINYVCIYLNLDVTSYQI